MGSSGNIVDLSLLELFAVELESNTRTIEQGLIGLESNNSTHIYESLMRAAHSIKGAARIIGLDKAVGLAHEMENIFEISRKSGEQVHEDKIQVLLDCNDIFASLLKCDIENIPGALDDSEEKILNLIKLLKHNDKNLHLSTHSKNGKNGTHKNKNATASNKEPVFVKRSSHDTVIEPYMLDLFRSELTKGCNKLLSLIKKLQEDFNLNSIVEINNTVISIKSSAKITGIEEISVIADKLLEMFNTVRDNKVSKINIEILENIISKISQIPESGKSSIIEHYISLDLDNILNEIDNVIPDDSAFKSEDSLESKQTVQALSKPISKENLTAKQEPASIENTAQDKKEERFVRVLSDNLNRLLGLTGEILVQTKSLKPFSKEMQKIKLSILELNSFKEQIYQELFKEGISDDINLKFHESSKQLDFILSTIIRFIENFESFSRRLEMTSDRLYNEAVETRMKPFSEGIIGFPRLVRDVSKQLGKKAEIEVKGANTRVDRDILEKLEAPLNHLVRNAIDHGLETLEERIAAGKPETGKIILEARHSSGMLLISIKDDGKGINLEELRKSIAEKGFSSKEMASALSPSELYDFLFLPGFSTRHQVTEISGRGVGLDVVFSMVNDVGGIIKVESEYGKGTNFQLQLPLTLSVIRTMLVEVGKEPYAIPLSRIDKVLSLNRQDIKSAESLQYLELNGENIGIVDAKQIFGLSRESKPRNSYNIVVLSDRLNRYGLTVDRLIAQPDLVVMPLDKKLGRIPNISSGAILEDGTPILIIDVDDTVRSIDRITKSGEIDKVASGEDNDKRKILHILVVDDSLTVREVERKLLENKGYKVTAAIDGIDGWNTLHRDKFDLIISDIDMPRMNGIELVKRIKSDIKFREIPVMIVSYKDREDDRKKGLEAGANYYLTKSSFHDDTLLEAVNDLIGKP
ncbi:MAG: hybrid sensor histidine kinase/response regulator [Candidatus Kapaibacterium sp.]